MRIRIILNQPGLSLACHRQENPRELYRNSFKARHKGLTALVCYPRISFATQVVLARVGPSLSRFSFEPLYLRLRPCPSSLY